MTADTFTTIGAAASGVVAKLAARVEKPGVHRIPIENREQWLELRKKDCTASTIGALFGLHPYETALGLYVEKSGVEMPEFDTSVLRRGRLLESAVAQAVAEEKPNWKITKATEYLRDAKARIGCTPDFWIEGDPRGPGVLQTKTVAPSIYYRDWTEDSPPFWVVLQNATEMMLSGCAWGAIAALVVDPWKLDLHIYEVPRHAAAEKKIREAVAQFWSDVDAGREPKAEYERDGALMSLLYPRETPGKIVDLTTDNMIGELLDERERAAATIKEATARKEAIDTEIKTKLGDAEAALISGWRLTWRLQQRKGYTVAATEFRRLNVSRERAA